MTVRRTSQRVRLIYPWNESKYPEGKATTGTAGEGGVTVGFDAKEGGSEVQEWRRRPCSAPWGQF